MSNAVKLYDNKGVFVRSAKLNNKFNDLKTFNENGLFAAAQMNKSLTEVVRSYAGVVKKTI